MTAARMLAAVIVVATSAALTARATAQGQVVSPGGGWPIAWMLFFFAVAALVAVVLFVLFAVRWRQDPPRPRR